MNFTNIFYFNRQAQIRLHQFQTMTVQYCSDFQKWDNSNNSQNKLMRTKSLLLKINHIKIVVNYCRTTPLQPTAQNNQQQYKLLSYVKTTTNGSNKTLMKHTNPIRKILDLPTFDSVFDILIVIDTTSQFSLKELAYCQFEQQEQSSLIYDIQHFLNNTMFLTYHFYFILFLSHLYRKKNKKKQKKKYKKNIKKYRYYQYQKIKLSYWFLFCVMFAIYFQINSLPLSMRHSKEILLLLSGHTQINSWMFELNQFNNYCIINITFFTQFYFSLFMRILQIIQDQQITMLFLSFQVQIIFKINPEICQQNKKLFELQNMLENAKKLENGIFQRQMQFEALHISSEIINKYYEIVFFYEKNNFQQNSQEIFDDWLDLDNCYQKISTFDQEYIVQFIEKVENQIIDYKKRFILEGFEINKLCKQILYLFKDSYHPKYKAQVEQVIHIHQNIIDKILIMNQQNFKNFRIVDNFQFLSVQIQQFIHFYNLEQDFQRSKITKLSILVQYFETLQQLKPHQQIDLINLVNLENVRDPININQVISQYSVNLRGKFEIQFILNNKLTKKVHKKMRKIFKTQLVQELMYEVRQQLNLPIDMSLDFFDQLSIVVLPNSNFKGFTLERQCPFLNFYYNGFIDGYEVILNAYCILVAINGWNCLQLIKKTKKSFYWYDQYLEDLNLEEFLLYKKLFGITNLEDKKQLFSLRYCGIIMVQGLASLIIILAIIAIASRNDREIIETWNQFGMKFYQRLILQFSIIIPLLSQQIQFLSPKIWIIFIRLQKKEKLKFESIDLSTVASIDLYAINRSILQQVSLMIQRFLTKICPHLSQISIEGYSFVNRQTLRQQNFLLDNCKNNIKTIAYRGTIGHSLKAFINIRFIYKNSTIHSG
ncbi:hypothetical protein pb186bvf_002684 [Paramecium bursaria]